MRRFGVRLGLVVLLVQSACLYSFVGGGLPDHIDTVAVLPFDNDTPLSVIPRELLDALRPDIESRLGLRSVAEARADAIVPSKSSSETLSRARSRNGETPPRRLHARLPLQPAGPRRSDLLRGERRR